MSPGIKDLSIMDIKTFSKKILKKIRGGRITLYPDSASRGRVLLSYKTEPFFEFEKKEHLHTNTWECREIANIFLRLGYTVDVTDWFDYRFTPHDHYVYFIDLGLQMERIGSLMNGDCIKIFHATTSHWLFNNTAEYQRLLDLQKRRGATLVPRRTLAPAHNIEHADFCTLIGNETTESTYSFANKKMHRIPLSTTHSYPFSEDKNIEKAKKNFVWLGGVGMVHKGLDLVLEAFSRMPEYTLSVCGNVSAEKDFEKLYSNELYHTSNIKTVGTVDMGGDVFKTIVDTSIALIYPSCSEGQSGSVITCMHAGLIPVMSLYSGVGAGNFAISLKENSVEEIVQTVQDISTMPNEELKKRSKDAWEYAREHHTREKFSEAFTKFVTMLESNK